MQEQLTLLAPLIGAGLTVAFFHAAIPTHWLPFVLAARGQGWGEGKTLAVVALAGSGHVLLTALLGALVVYLGIQVGESLGRTFAWIAGGALVAVGAYYLWKQARGGAHGHVHLFGGHAHDAHHHSHAGHDHVHPHGGPRHATLDATRRSDSAVIGGLIALLTFSPCEGFLPIYGAGIVLGWTGFVLLSVVLAVATVSAMVLFTGLTLAGLARLDLSRIARFEAGLQGTMFVGLGLLVIATEALG